MLAAIFYKYGAVILIQEKASVFSYPGYPETVKIVKNCYWFRLWMGWKGYAFA